MSLGVSDNVLLEAHSDGQNSQHPKLMAQKIGQHFWSFCWSIISILVATLRRTASNCIHKLNVDGQQILGRNESGMHSTMWRGWGVKIQNPKPGRI